MVGEFVLLLIFSLALLVIVWEFSIIRRIRADKAKNKTSEETAEPSNNEAAEECPHFHGYLADHPKEEPIPDECFGCKKAIECMNANQTPNENRYAPEQAVEEEEPQHQ